MSAVDAGVVLLPRFTALAGNHDFETTPMEVSRQGGIQLQVWRGPIRTTSGPGTLGILMQESLDGLTWSQPGASGATAGSALLVPESAPLFLSWTFRLRWWKVTFVLSGTNPLVTCWAEGLLRGGGEGAWGGAAVAPAPETPAGRTTTPGPYAGILGDYGDLAAKFERDRLAALDFLDRARASSPASFWIPGQGVKPPIVLPAGP